MTLYSAQKKVVHILGGRLSALSNTPTYFLEVGSLISLCNVVIMGSFKSLQCCDSGSSLIGGSLGSLWRCGLYQAFETRLSWELILTKTQILMYIHIYLCRWQFHIFLDKDNNISMQVATSYFHRQIQCVSQYLWHFHISFDKAMLIHPPSHTLTIVLLTHINWSLQGVHNCHHF